MSERTNSFYAIALAQPVAERWRDMMRTALDATGQEWRSDGLQAAFLTAEIAEAIDNALRANGVEPTTILSEDSFLEVCRQHAA